MHIYSAPSLQRAKGKLFFVCKFESIQNVLCVHVWEVFWDLWALLPYLCTLYHNYWTMDITHMFCWTCFTIVSSNSCIRPVFALKISCSDSYSWTVCLSCMAYESLAQTVPISNGGTKCMMHKMELVNEKRMITGDVFGKFTILTVPAYSLRLWYKLVQSSIKLCLWLVCGTQIARKYIHSCKRIHDPIIIISSYVGDRKKSGFGLCSWWDFQNKLHR